MVFNFYIPLTTHTFERHASAETATIALPANYTDATPAMEEPERIASHLLTALDTIKPPIIEAILEVTDTAQTILVFAIGLALAVLMLYAMSILINLIAFPFTRKKTVEQLMAHSLGKTAYWVVAAWKEGWTAAAGNNDTRDGEARLKRARVALHVVPAQSNPDTKEDFKMITDVDQQQEDKTPEADRRNELFEGDAPAEDGELVENMWVRDL
ncbi:hypothetical protein BU23DRAFT_315741 [Bimuria novae-zelandiae CBS 107.79]|uniref:Uncharacterized protein n=1 Tax=Bimuria novae-zelandiae CBS 107.79 TaxID=1447943 RepID=A0A6A5UQ44_9PLEO|nr:hypothetical protein BU23DRAFT_315741 [Bimuria novae-zelandiae CBS 107.79]